MQLSGSRERQRQRTVNIPKLFWEAELLLLGFQPNDEESSVQSQTTIAGPLSSKVEISHPAIQSSTPSPVAKCLNSHGCGGICLCSKLIRRGQRDCGFPFTAPSRFAQVRCSRYDYTQALCGSSSRRIPVWEKKPRTKSAAATVYHPAHVRMALPATLFGRSTLQR